jgi:HEPN superfamily RiboL-PSP-like protein
MLVDVLFAEHRDLLVYLEERNEPSFVGTLQSTMPKIVLLAGASYLETEVQRIVTDFYKEVTASHSEALAFVRNKALKRQYHTFFAWDDGKANAFFGLFGETCLTNYKAAVKANQELAKAATDFCRLGSLRNQLVHGNYAAFGLDLTAEEVYALYRSAAVFVDRLPALIRMLPID